MKATKGNGNKMLRVFFVFGLALVLLASWGAPTSALEKEKPKYGGTLRWFTKKDPPTMDPHRHVRAQCYGPSSLVFSNLVRSTMQSIYAVEPDLAKRWEVSADGKSYTFYLYKGVKWHDGQPFTAEDVKYSLEKMADPKTGAQTSNLLIRFERAEVVDKHTIKVYISAPQSSFLNFLTLPFCKILPKHILEAGIDHKSTDFLVGTGPFKMKKYQKGIMWEVERYADYHHEGLPYLDGIVSYIIKDTDAQVSALITKRLDMSAPAHAYASQAEVENIKAGAPEVIVKPYISGNSRLLRFGLKNPDSPLQDPRVRKAIILVADQKELMIAGTGGVERCAPAGFIYPFGPYALPEKELASYMGTDKPYKERVAEAKRLLRAAGVSEGLELRVLMDVGPRYRRIGEMLGEQVRQIGIKLKLDVQETAKYIKTRLSGDFDLQTGSIIAPLGDPDEQISTWVTDNPRNYGRYSNPKIDKLYRRSTEVTGAERVKVIQDAAREMWADPPAAPAYYYGYIVAWQPYVKGFRNPGALDFNIGLVDQVWLDK